MKIGLLRKIYPYISHNKKNLKWRSLTDAELDASVNSKQMIANCFDEATRTSLLESTKGRDLLRKRIKIQKNQDIDQAYKIKLNVNGKDEIYKSTIDNYFGRDYGLYKAYHEDPNGMYPSDKPTRLSLGIGVALNKMIFKHPSQKSIFSRFYMYPLINNRRCEYNKPSNAFKWYTGIQPKSIGEDCLHFTLRPHKEEVLDLLNNLGDKSSKDYSFVAVNAFSKNPNGYRWHTCSIIDVDKDKKEITLWDKHANNKFPVTFDDVVNKYKSIVGIIWDKGKTN